MGKMAVSIKTYADHLPSGSQLNSAAQFREYPSRTNKFRSSVRGWKDRQCQRQQTNLSERLNLSDLALHETSQGSGHCEFWGEWVLLYRLKDPTIWLNWGRKIADRWYCGGNNFSRILKMKLRFENGESCWDRQWIDVVFWKEVVWVAFLGIAHHQQRLQQRLT